jgi:hypothetical protein
MIAAPRPLSAAAYFRDLRVRMAAASISATALAQQLGQRSPAQLSRWLNGRTGRGVRAETLERVEIAFGQLTGQGGPTDVGR